MILYVSKEKIFIDKTEHSIPEPTSQTNGVRFVVSQEYTSIFAIPAFPNGPKKVAVYTLKEEQEIPKKNGQ